MLLAVTRKEVSVQPIPDKELEEFFAKDMQQEQAFMLKFICDKFFAGKKSV